MLKIFRKREKYASLGRDSYIYNPMIICGAKKISIGNNVKILDNARISIYDNEEDKIVIQIDDGCYIGYNFSILAKAKVHIENNVLIASNVLISSENHGIDPESDLYYMKQSLEGKDVRIGEGTWIGEKVCVLPGVNIGKKCVIGAGSIVTKSIPDYSIAVGNPAKVVKKYDFDLHEWIRI